MAVPDYQSLMGPLLAEHLGKGRIQIDADLQDLLATQFGLSAGDREERHPKTPNLTALGHRLAWASVYLGQAGLIRRLPNGEGTEITTLGEKALANGPQEIDASSLERFPAFWEFLQQPE